MVVLSDNQRTADKVRAAVAEEDAANWAHGEKHEWGVSVFLHVVLRGAGKRGRVSGAMCRAYRSVIRCLALSERLGETLRANSTWLEVIVVDANSQY